MTTTAVTSEDSPSVAKVRMTLARNLFAARTEKKLSRARLAQLSGVHLSVVQRIEMGQVLPNVATLVLLADALDIVVADLFVVRSA